MTEEKIMVYPGTNVAMRVEAHPAMRVRADMAVSVTEAGHTVDMHPPLPGPITRRLNEALGAIWCDMDWINAK